ncbi:hypothetical protein [Rhizobium sp. CCGE 510]|uniref:hypothetical protein n=1 Tax=Rhizobium sp. CCGE 510 TaxID=1132836 RepID=UPI00027B817E|nr:hypothetical protein [Rhizobium sp. CCGE 510]EJT04261.1 hypothetical protein RCCGE510_15617 [Rhizobium sp. CCGE 510]
MALVLLDDKGRLHVGARTIQRAGRMSTTFEASSMHAAIDFAGTGSRRGHHGVVVSIKPPCVLGHSSMA